MAEKMEREHYRIFSSGRIGRLTLRNRLVRSATWDPSVLPERCMRDEVLQLYRRLAGGGVGMIVTGDFSVAPEGLFERAEGTACTYDDVRIAGFGQLAETVHRTAPDCRIVAQVSGEYPGVGPSAVESPFPIDPPRPLTAAEIRRLVDCFAVAIAGVQADGFDGAQLHAAHGGLLSRFLSPYTNRRSDEYSGSAANRARIVGEIVAAARARVGDFPILIKMNGTDYVPGGINGENLPELAVEITRAGVDAIEISGGMWDCLLRSEEELGFRPVPSPEAHVRLQRPEQQSYFLPYAARLDVDVPLILVGGNRDVERLEGIVQGGTVDFVAMCRPFICEPELPQRWLAGRGSSGTECISCNTCLVDMYDHLERGEPWVARCLFKEDRAQVRAAQRWLRSWVQENALEGK